MCVSTMSKTKSAKITPVYYDNAVPIAYLTMPLSIIRSNTTAICVLYIYKLKKLHKLTHIFYLFIPI